jgi:hypothetical protein
MKKKSGLADSPFFTPPEQQIRELPESLIFFHPVKDETIVKAGEGEDIQENVRKRTSGHVHKRTSGQADMQTSGHLSWSDFWKLYLDDKGAAKETFRLPPDLIETIGNLPFQIKMAHKVKVSKKDLVTLALSYLIWDYEKNGNESLLFKHLIHPK